MRRIIFCILSAFSFATVILPATPVQAQTPVQMFWLLNQTPVIVACPGVATASDPHAQAFLCATKISDQTIGDAVNQMAISLKANNLWDSMVAVYPLVSDGVLKTRSEQTSINLKDTSKFKITWDANVTFSATGVDFSISTSSGNTGINPSIDLLQATTALGYYSREDRIASGWDWLAFNGSSSQLRMQVENGSGSVTASMYNGSNTTLNGSNGGTSKGMYIAARTALTGAGSVALYKNGSLISSPTLSLTAGTLVNAVLALGATASTSGQRECAGAFAYKGVMNATGASSVSSIFNTLNTSLSRNIY